MELLEEEAMDIDNKTNNDLSTAVCSVCSKEEVKQYNTSAVDVEENNEGVVVNVTENIIHCNTCNTCVHKPCYGLDNDVDDGKICSIYTS